MNADDLKKYGLKRVARVHIAGRKLVIDQRNQKAVMREKCIYAFLIMGKYIRIGSSKAPLDSRLTNYERDFTKALNGGKSSTSDEEARTWRKILPAGTFGFVYARQGTKVKTRLGEFRAYLDEESILIRELFDKHRPDQILNRNKHR